MPTNATQAYEDLRPFIDQLVNNVATAPINNNERLNLALIVTSRFFGLGCSAMEQFMDDCHGQPTHVIAPKLWAILQKSTRRGLN